MAAAWLYEALLSKLLWTLPLDGLSTWVMYVPRPRGSSRRSATCSLAGSLGPLGSQLVGIVAMSRCALILLDLGRLVRLRACYWACENLVMDNLSTMSALGKGGGNELLRFGGWIMLSSALALWLLQGDRAILGVFLPTVEKLGPSKIST